jgi:geranylgeranyl reductase
MLLPESVEHVVVGAGPAGLRAAQVLAERGREVLVLERNVEVGPKTCAGGLTVDAVRELAALGLPADVGVSHVIHGSWRGEGPFPIESPRAVVRTVPRRVLGALQASWTRAAGAEIRTGVAASAFDFGARTLEAGGRRVRWRHLIAADGSTSGVRRALALPTPRAYFAAEFNVRGAHRPEMVIAFDSRALASGYYWVFPHGDYVSVGAGAHKRAVPPGAMRAYIRARAESSGMTIGDTPFEGATIEVAFAGLHPRDGVHLVGDAAGVASGLTAEGIYPALVSGEEVARRILDPSYPEPKMAAWLGRKARHDRLGALWLRRAPREASFRLLAALWRRPRVRSWMARVLL